MSDGLVFVVDDDDGMRRALARLLAASGYRVETFGSPLDFIERAPHESAACLVLDLKMPEMTGLQLQERLLAAGHRLPIVFITGHGDIPTSVLAMRHGAVDFLSKPFEDRQLLAAVDAALARDRAALSARLELRELVVRWESMTPREREVCSHVVQGRLNKQIATRLGIAEKTIKVHRGRVMEKMAADSLADLVRMAHALREVLPEGAI